MIEAEERPIADRLEGVAPPSDSMDLLGHTPELEKLAESYRAGRLHHAWLISAPRGVGKATFAFHMARYILSNPEPAQAPESVASDLWPETVVRQVSQASQPDLLHLARPWDDKTKKFKTQLSINEIRKTQSFYGMTAGSNGWRITIVDAADDMNASAANALLKVLEEPPKRSIFFVLTHSAGSLLPTIRSRCQLLPLKPLADQVVLEKLASFDLGVPKPELEEISALAEGSVRRAVVLAQGDVLSEYRQFLKLLESGAKGSASDWVIVHQIADSVSRRGREDAYSLFIDLAVSWIGKQVRMRSDLPPHVLAGWAEVWDKAIQSTKLADAFNLDKKQVILSLFGSLFSQNKI